MNFKKTLFNLFSVLIITTLMLVAMPAQSVFAAGIEVNSSAGDPAMWRGHHPFEVFMNFCTRLVMYS